VKRSKLQGVRQNFKLQSKLNPVQYKRFNNGPASINWKTLSDLGTNPSVMRTCAAYTGA